MKIVFLYLLLPALSAFLLTGLLRIYALKTNLLDMPNQRSSHVVPVPRGGGLAIVLVFMIGLALLFVNQELDKSVLLAFLGAGMIIALVGLFDDHGNIPPKWRILVHFVAVIWGLLWLRSMPPIVVFGQVIHPGWLGYVLLAIALVWLLNLFNFMDGIDGIASSEAIFVATSAFIFAKISAHADLQLVAIILIGSTLGFLIWNWHPAKIFMGDVGSGFLGITLGIYAYWSILKDSMSLWTWLIILGVFIVDATFTLIRRVLRKDAWYKAHRSHAYQHAAQRWGHLPVTLVIILINIFWLFPIAYFSNLYRDVGLDLMLLALTPLIVLVFLLGAGKET